MDNKHRNLQENLHENVPNPDINNIAASLQALLGIPPITKTKTHDNSNRVDDTQIGKPVPTPSFASLFQNANVSAQPQQQPRSKDLGSVSSDHQISGRQAARRIPNAQNKFPNSASDDRTSSTANSNSLPRHSPVKQPGYDVKFEKPHQRYSGPSNSDAANGAQHNRYSRDSRYESRPQENKPRQRSGTPIKQLLSLPECPSDLKQSSQLLIDSSLNEYKPTNFLHDEEPVVKLFRKHAIEPLKKKSPKFPKAKYFCDLCNYHMDTVYNAISHIVNLRHRQNARKQEMGQMLHCIGAPSQSHQVAISRYILSIVERYGISNQEISDRQRIVDELNFQVTSANLPCHLTLFGSSASGFGFKTSDVNINVTMELKNEAHPDANEQAQILNELYRTLQNSPNCREVTELFSAKLMSIKFVDTATGKLCVIHANNTSGVALARLFTEYDKCDSRVRPLLIMFRYFAKLGQIDNQNEGTLPSHCYSILALHYLQTCGVVPNLHRVLGKEADDSVNVLDEFAGAAEVASVWRTNNQHNVGFLWLDLLNYYAIRFMAKEEVVSITQNELLRKSDNIWNRKLSIQDPILKRSNLSRSLCSNKICDYIIDRICATFRYFAIPRTMSGPLYDGILHEKVATFRGLRMFHSERPDEKCHTDPKWARYVHGTNHLGRETVVVILEDIHLAHEKLEVHEYAYDLDQNIIQEGEKPPKICKSCGTEGHLKKDCPDETVPMIRPVRLPSRFTLQVLSEVMCMNYDREALNEQDVQLRQRITHDICGSLKPEFHDVDLTMFGSTYNGFGLHLSDVDICLRFTKNPINKATITQEEVTKILTTVVDRLKATGNYQNIIAIPSAKVPIVKFTHQKSRLEGDISLSNILALHNTKMLATYCAIDNRLKILGCFLKKVTKLCDVSDASKGSLSSYGFVLMLIHFLQQHNPPVLPVLQELPPKSTVMVDGCNAWFYDDIQTLKNVWPEIGRNQESVAQLWLSFLIYYTEIFNFEEHIIQIHQKSCVTRFSKLWLTDTLIAVQDPFDHAHNLGAGLSRRMGVYIVKCFQRFRDSFHLSVDHVRTNDWMDFFLNLRRIRGNSNPPIDRQCRICNRIGHFARNCTQNLVLENGGLEPTQKLDGEMEEPFSPDGGSDQKNTEEVEWINNRLTESDLLSLKEQTNPSRPLDKDDVNFQNLNGSVETSNSSFPFNSPFSVFNNDPRSLMSQQNQSLNMQPFGMNQNAERQGVQSNQFGNDESRIQQGMNEIEHLMRTMYQQQSGQFQRNSLQSPPRLPESPIHAPFHGPIGAGRMGMINRADHPNANNDVIVPPPGFRPLGLPSHPFPQYPMFPAGIQPNAQFLAREEGDSPRRGSEEFEITPEYQERLRLVREQGARIASETGDVLNEFQNLSAGFDRDREAMRAEDMSNRAPFNVPRFPFPDIQLNRPLDVGGFPIQTYNMVGQPPMVLMSQGQALNRAGDNPPLNPYMGPNIHHPYAQVQGLQAMEEQQFHIGQPNFPQFQHQMRYPGEPQQSLSHPQQAGENEQNWPNFRNPNNLDSENNEPRS